MHLLSSVLRDIYRSGPADDLEIVAFSVLAAAAVGILLVFIVRLR